MRSIRFAVLSAATLTMGCGGDVGAQSGDGGEMLSSGEVAEATSELPTTEPGQYSARAELLEFPFPACRTLRRSKCAA